MPIINVRRFAERRQLCTLRANNRRKDVQARSHDWLSVLPWPKHSPGAIVPGEFYFKKTTNYLRLRRCAGDCIDIAVNFGA